MKKSCEREGIRLETEQLSDMSVKWSAVQGAEYYVLHDDNSNITEVKFFAGDVLNYKPFTVGEHDLTLDVYKKGKKKAVNFSLGKQTVPMCFAYHSSMFNRYTCREGDLNGLGLTCGGLEKNDYGRYIVYYNVEKGFVKSESEATDFSEERYLEEYFNYYKKCGMNVLMPSSFTVFQYPMEWETSGLKKFMDIAWYKYGLKTIVWDNDIFELPRRESLTFGQVKERLAAWYYDESRGIKHYTRHPGFYGVELTDEPFSTREKNGKHLNEVVVAGYCYRALKEIFKENGVNSAFTCALNKYPYVFRGEKGYKEYLKDWLTASGADFIGFDVYLPSVSNDPAAPHVVTLQHFETTWKCIREAADEYGLRIDAAVTAFDFSLSGTHNALNFKDVLQNAYYALCYGTDSFCWFCASRFSVGEITHTIFGYDGKPTETFGWVRQVNENLVKLRYYLYGYKYESSNVVNGESYQFVKTLWKGEKGGFAHFYINMNTSADNSPCLAFSFSGEKYVYCNARGGIEEGVADKETAFWLISGELLIVFNNQREVIQYGYED